jgi:hypothetical protein
LPQLGQDQLPNARVRVSRKKGNEKSAATREFPVEKVSTSGRNLNRPMSKAIICIPSFTEAVRERSDRQPSSSARNRWASRFAAWRVSRRALYVHLDAEVNDFVAHRAYAFSILKKTAAETCTFSFCTSSLQFHLTSIG